MTDIIKMERGKGVFVLTIHRNRLYGISQCRSTTTFYLPSKKSVRMLVRMYVAQYGYNVRDFTLAYFNTGLIVSKDCDVPHFNIIDVDVAEAIA